MADARLAPVLRHIQKLVAAPRAREEDAPLLERFAHKHDQDAFEALVRRHGPLVWRVCRQVLGDEHLAEDAFQATFLILARKATSVRKPGSLASWLHGVAFRVAHKARANLERRDHQSMTSANPSSDPGQEAAWRELGRTVEEEVHGLPEKYRAVLLLCYWEGLTGEEAARRLGWPPGTVKTRLARARQLLHGRLTRRGVALSAGAVMPLLAPGSVGSAVPETLAAATARAGVGFAATQGTAAGVSAKVAALTEGVLQSMATGKLKVGMALLVAATLVAAGTGALAHQVLASKQPDARQRATPVPAAKGMEPTRPRTEKQARTDRHGDALPEGAIQRFGSARLRHGGVVRTSTLAPDGKTLATAGDHSVIIWNLDTGQAARRFPCEHGSTFIRPGLAFSSDGRRLAYVRNTFFACVWDVKTGKELRRLERRFEDGLDHFWGNSCQFTRDGKEVMLLSRSAIETWDVGSGKQTASVSVKMPALLSPDGRTYLRSEGAAGLSLGDARTGIEITRLPVEVRCSDVGLAFSPDGKTLALVHAQKEIQLRTAAGDRFLGSFPLPDSARKEVIGGGPYWEYRVAFSADGKTLLLGTSRGLIHRWDVASGKELPALKKHASAVAGMHTLPDGRTLVSTAADGVIRRWDLKTGREESEADSYEGRSAAAYSPDGRFAAVGDARGRLDLWDGHRGTLIRTFQRTGAGVTHLAFSPDGKHLAAAEQSGTVRFWEVPSGRPGDVWQRKTRASEWFCNGIHFSPDGRFLCVSDYPRQIRLVAVPGGKLVWRGDGSSFGEAFSPDGTTLLVARVGPYLARLDAVTGMQRSRVRMNEDIPEGVGSMVALAFSPDGRRLAVTHEGGSLLLCDGRTCAETRCLVDGGNLKRKDLEVLKGARPRNRFRALGFSPDGKWLASAGTDAAVYVWEAATGQEVLCRSGHEAEVSSVAFSPDGKKVFSYGGDGQGYLWSLQPQPVTGRRVALKALWTDLAGTDAKKAHRAVRTLSEEPGAVAFLRKHLFPAAPPDEARVAKLIADLDSDRFDVREEAGRELEGLEALVEGPLRKALGGRPSPEVKRRVEALLSGLSAGVTPTVLRSIRVTAVLEYTATPEARQLLEMLARGTPQARLTEEAKASLERLSRRHSVKP